MVVGETHHFRKLPYEGIQLDLFRSLLTLPVLQMPASYFALLGLTWIAAERLVFCRKKRKYT